MNSFWQNGNTHMSFTIKFIKLLKNSIHLYKSKNKISIKRVQIEPNVIRFAFAYNI